MNERFAVASAVHLVLRRDDRVLLLRRLNTGYEDGKWSLPAGHLDGGETVRTAAAREASEELGVRVAPEGIRFAHVMHRRKEDGERIDFFVVAESWDGEVRNAEPEKCSHLSWVDPDDLPAELIPYVRAGISHTLDGIPYSEFGW